MFRVTITSKPTTLPDGSVLTLTATVDAAEQGQAQDWLDICVEKIAAAMPLVRFPGDSDEGKPWLTMPIRNT